ncbi:MAG: hypothetical protein WD795_01215 [Woeseia sp.]
MESETAPVAGESDRWILARDMFVFQLKLIADSILDLVLLPVSLIVGIVSLLGRGPKPGPEFYELLRLGRHGEQWINLFGDARRRPERETGEGKVAAKDLDDLISRVESFLVDEYRNGSITARTRQSLAAALDSLQSLSKQRKSPPD